MLSFRRHGVAQAQRLFLVLVLVISCVSLAAQGPVRLPLYNGIYVPEDVPCDNPPTSAILKWDGAGFSGAYGNLCITNVFTGSEGGTYQVDTYCKVNSDGIRDEVNIPRQILVLRSTSTFTLHSIGRGADTAKNYRRCATH